MRNAESFGAHFALPVMYALFLAKQCQICLQALDAADSCWIDASFTSQALLVITPADPADRQQASVYLGSPFVEARRG